MLGDFFGCLGVFTVLALVFGDCNAVFSPLIMSDLACFSPFFN